MKRIACFVVVLLALGTAAFASGQAEAADETPGTATADVSQREAPMLARLVEAGELPPVEERLPKNPPVIQTVEQLGIYGGTVRTLSQETTRSATGSSSSRVNLR